MSKVEGKDDQPVEEFLYYTQEGLIARIKKDNFKFKFIQNSTHNMVLENPKEVAREIRDFVG